MQKTWFITGAGRGLGAEIAKAASAAGHNVVATARDASALSNVIPSNETTLAVSLDVNDAAGVTKAVDEAVAQFGRIDVLVNNAGYGHLGIFEESTDDDVRRQFETNVFGLMKVTRAVLPTMRRQRSGNILNMSSIGGLIGFDSCVLYGASKFAVEGFSLNLAKDVERFGISVTAVEPGYFRTEFLEPGSIQFAPSTIDDYAEARATHEAYASYSKNQPGDPVKLAKVLVEIVEAGKLPLQLLLGSDALGLAEADLGRRSEDLETWRSTSKSTDLAA